MLEGSAKIRAEREHTGEVKPAVSLQEVNAAAGVAQPVAEPEPAAEEEAPAAEAPAEEVAAEEAAQEAPAEDNAEKAAE